MAEQKQFRSDKHEISCRTMNTIIRYVREHGRDVASLIEGLPYDEKYLTDTNNWVCREAADEITSRLRVMFDDDEIIYKIALASEKFHTFGFLDYLARLIGNPLYLIKLAPQLNKYFTRVGKIEVLKSGSSSATIRYSTDPGYPMTAGGCYYTKGILTILPRIWGGGYAKVREETCAVPVDKKGALNGKRYTIDENGYVIEQDVQKAKAGQDIPITVGKINPDGSFKLDGTLYGAPYCICHISWVDRKMWVRRIFYELFIKPKVLKATLEELQRENDVIMEKYEELYQKNQELQKHYVDTINALIRTIDVKDHYTQDHSLNVCSVAAVIARELGLDLKKINTIEEACKLHDLGKIGIKDSILLKPGKLTDEEWAEIKKHPILGAEIIRPLTFLSDAAVLIRQDHERWDGAGYPDGLQGEQIDIGARIIALADAYDAMTSGRPYRKPMSRRDAAEEIMKHNGTQFDPQVVEAFMKALPKLL